MVLTGLLMLGLSTLPTPAAAGSGILEINQACAEGGGCFPGDSPGFPVTLSNSAGATSFRLTSDLVVTGSASGLVVTRLDASIDLRGFRIISAGCVGKVSAGCAPASVIGGIDASSTAGVSVRDGEIVGMGQHGLVAGSFADVEGVYVRWHTGDGMKLGGGSRVIEGVSEENGGDGIELGLEGLVDGAIVAGNAGHGVFAPKGPTVLRRIVARSNGLTGVHATEAVLEDSEIDECGAAGAVSEEQAGIWCPTTCVLRRNSVEDSAGRGIHCGSECVVAGNRVGRSGDDGIACSVACTIDGNLVVDTADEAIRAINGSRVVGNTITDSDDDGIVVGTSSAYNDNAIADVADDFAAGNGDNLGGNVCDGSLCP